MFSVSGFQNIGVGIFIGVIIAHYLIFKINIKSGILASITSIVILQLMLYGGVHGEDRHIEGLSKFSISGPSGYIRTTDDKVKFIDDLRNDINRVRRSSDKTIVVNGVFPLVFLMSNLRPYARNLWINIHGEEFITKDYYEKLQKYPDMLVVLNENKAGYITNLSKNGSYHVVVIRDRTTNLNWSYEIYLKN
jgi:hypothetical protein